MQLHTQLIPDVIVREAGLARSHVQRSLRNIKAAGRISSGRPYAPPLTAKDVARILLAITAPASGRAVSHERSIGQLPLLDGNSTYATAQDAVVAIIEAAVGIRLPEFNADGVLIVGQTRPLLAITSCDESSHYGLQFEDCGAFFHLPISTIEAVSKELLGKY